MKKNSGYHLALVLLLSAAVTACGGGGGGGSGGGINPLHLGTVSTAMTYSGSIDAYGTDFFSFTTGTISGTYTISLTNTESHLSWALLSDPRFTQPVALCNSTMLFATDEICQVTLTSGTTYYLAVDEWNMVAGTYTLDIAAPVAPAVPPGVGTTAGSGKVSISWSASMGATSYNIYWSTTPGGASSGGSKISGIKTTIYDHLVSSTSSTYYYVVTAQNASGESAKSSPEVSAKPMAALAPPLAYDFDGGTLQGWTANGTWANGTWGVTTAYSHSANYSVTDSPSGNYQYNSNTWLISPMIDLTATTAPKLTFWHRYDMQGGFVELSTNGGSTWIDMTPPPGYYIGTVSTFTLVTIDLTFFKSSSQVFIRFRLRADNIPPTYDGWYIDDIAISVN